MSGGAGYQDRKRRERADLDFVEAELHGSGRIAPVGSDPEERQRWLLHDLASLIEGCFHERVNLAALDEPAKASWQARLGNHFIFPSVEAWDEYLLGVGEPEGLAYKIGVFEDVAREQGWSVATQPIPGLDRWRAWARGEEHGGRVQQLRDMETVLSARRWQVERELLEQAQRADPYFGFEQLLRRAVTTESFDEWRRELERTPQEPTEGGPEG